jgi:hypothetical protein
MDRPAYITRCPLCFEVLIVPDDYQTKAAIIRVEGKERQPRMSNPDEAIERHIHRSH